MSTRIINIGGIYALSSKREGSKFKMVVRACRQLNKQNTDSKIAFQDFISGDLFDYSGDQGVWLSSSVLEIEDLWQDFNVEYLGSDIKNLFRFAHQSTADRL